MMKNKNDTVCKDMYVSNKYIKNGVCTSNKPLNDSYNYNNLRNKPQINNIILIGQMSSADLKLYGEGNPETYVFEQKVASTLWHIKHNLNKFPSVTVVDSAGSIVVGEVIYIDKEILEISFSGGFSGVCYLN